MTTLTARGSPSGGRGGCCGAGVEVEVEEEEVGANGIVVEPEAAEGEAGCCGKVAAAARAAAAAVGVSDRGRWLPSPPAEGDEEAEGPPAEVEVEGGLEEAFGQATAVALTTWPKVPLPSRSSIT